MPRSTGWRRARRSIWGKLVVGAGEADLEAFDLSEPAFAFGFGDARPLGGIRPMHAAP